MPILAALLFVTGIVFGGVFRKRVPQTSKEMSRGGMSRGGMSRDSWSGVEETFAPQLANLKIALERPHKVGAAYSAARAAGILR